MNAAVELKLQTNRDTRNTLDRLCIRVNIQEPTHSKTG